MNVRLRVALLSHLPFLLVFFLLLQGLTGCHERVTNPNLEASLDDYDSLSSKVLLLSPHKFRRALNEMLSLLTAILRYLTSILVNTIQIIITWYGLTGRV